MNDKVSRRKLLKYGAGVAGIAGLATIAAQCGGAAAPTATTAPAAATTAPAAATTAPAAATTAPAAAATVAVPEAVKTQVLRTIGLSVTVQDRILEEFKKIYGVKSTTGTAATLPDATNKIITGGAKDYDVNETIGERIPAQIDANAIIEVPVQKIANWQYALEMFTKTDPKFDAKAQISGQIWKEDGKTLWMVPTVYNFDSVGWRPDKMDEPTSWTAIFDEKYKGKSGLNTDPLIAFPEVMISMNTLGLLDIKNFGNPNKEQIDEGIKWVTEKKKAGQFRSLWGDFGELVNLMASGEMVVADAWQPAVMAVKAQGVPCRYATPKEGYRAWSIGISIVKDTPNIDAAYAYIDFWLSGWPAITVSEQGYYSPVTTIKDAMPKNKYDFWYEGKPWVGAEERGIKEGDLRDGGSLIERSSKIAVWHQWPDEYDYLIQKWDEFLSA